MFLLAVVQDQNPQTPIRLQGRFWRFAGRFHKHLYRWTGGLVGGRLRGELRALLLTTTGRKSGKRRTVPLPYTSIGDELVLVASLCGSDRDPAWSLNLKAQPEAEVQVGRKVRRVRAEQATAEERQRMWPQITGHIPELAEFQKLTDRQFPIFILRDP